MEEIKENQDIQEIEEITPEELLKEIAETEQEIQNDVEVKEGE